MLSHTNLSMIPVLTQDYSWLQRMKHQESHINLFLPSLSLIKLRGARYNKWKVQTENHLNTYWKVGGTIATYPNSESHAAYRRPSFNCKSLINAIAILVHKSAIITTHLLICNVKATLQVQSKMTILRYLKPVTGNNLSTPDEPGLSASITKEVNQSVERAIAGNRRAPNNGAKGKYDRQTSSWEWQHCSY